MCMEATEILTNLLTPSSCELIYQLIVFQLVEIFYNLFMENEGLLLRSQEQNVIPYLNSQATSHYPILLFNISFNIIFQSACKSSNLFIFFKFSGQMCVCNFCVSCFLHDPPISLFFA
jgi:hypothetical protein